MTTPMISKLLNGIRQPLFIEGININAPKKRGRPPRPTPITPAEATKVSRSRWQVENPETGVTNIRVDAWIPDTPAARAALKRFAAQLRRDAGTTVPEDLIF